MARYYALLERARPRFSKREAHLVCEILGGIAFEAKQDVTPQLRLAFSQASNARYEKWGVTKQAFLERVRGFSQTEGLAVVDAVEQYFDGQAHRAPFRT